MPLTPSNRYFDINHSQVSIYPFLGLKRSLPEDIVDADNINTFKNKLDSHWADSHYDIPNIEADKDITRHFHALR